jgi:uridine kinase
VSAPAPDEAALVAAVLEAQAGRATPLVVGIDGRSGGGKSTLAAGVAARLPAEHGRTVAVIEGDQFYAGGSSATWDARTAEEKAGVVIDWRRQRAVLEALLADGVAEWRPFDWEADDWDADEVPLLAAASRAATADVIVLEGAYSCRPELHDLLDLLVLLDPPTDRRRQQLLDREGERYRADWEGRWAEAEDHYFGAVMPPARFHLVLGTCEAPG